MGIYDKEVKEKKALGLNFNLKKLKYPLAVIIIAVLIVVIYYLVVGFTKSDPIQASFSSNPLDISSNPKNDSLLSVTVWNPLDQDLSNAVIEVTPIDQKSLRVLESKQTVSVLGRGENRTLPFVVEANAPAKEIASGNYEIEIKFTAGSNVYSKRVTLTVKSV
ncbi:MAG: hypothetical protein AB1467_05170 [Candidatus Diapherotrites archaeon]